MQVSSNDFSFPFIAYNPSCNYIEFIRACILCQDLKIQVAYRRVKVHYASVLNVNCGFQIKEGVTEEIHRNHGKDS